MTMPTKRELAILESVTTSNFRERVADAVTEKEMTDNMFLLRWLRARDLNLEKAQTMLRNAKKRRQENNLNNVIPGVFTDPYFPKTFPLFVDGTDKEGRPVITIPIGKWDVRKILRNGKSADFVIYLTECFELGMHSLRVAAKRHEENQKEKISNGDVAPITQFVHIFDWPGFAWSQLLNHQCVQNFLKIASIYEAYYPELLYKAYFINCPTVISSVLVLIKPILAPKTMGKIEVFGTNENQWKEKILKEIDEKQLRRQFGGSRLE